MMLYGKHLYYQCFQTILIFLSHDFNIIHRIFHKYFYVTLVLSIIIFNYRCPINPLRGGCGHKVGHQGAMSLPERVYTHLDVNILIDAVSKIYHP